MEAIYVGLTGFAGYIALTLLALRFFRGASPALVVMVSAGICYGVLVLSAVVIRPPFMFWPSSAAYWFTTICFLMIFGASYKSISLRILLDLWTSPGRMNTYEAIQRRYVQKQSYQDRLNILVTEGFAIHGPDGFSLLPKGRYIGGAVAAVQRMFRIDRSG